MYFVTRHTFQIKDPNAERLLNVFNQPLTLKDKSWLARLFVFAAFVYSRCRYSRARLRQQAFDSISALALDAFDEVEARISDRKLFHVMTQPLNDCALVGILRKHGFNIIVSASVNLSDESCPKLQLQYLGFFAELSRVETKPAELVENLKKILTSTGQLESHLSTHLPRFSIVCQRLSHAVAASGYGTWTGGKTTNTKLVILAEKCAQDKYLDQFEELKVLRYVPECRLFYDYAFDVANLISIQGSALLTHKSIRVVLADGSRFTATPKLTGFGYLKRSVSRCIKSLQRLDMVKESS